MLLAKLYFRCVEFCLSKLVIRVAGDLESREINLVGKVGEFCWWSGENDVYRPSCVTVVFCCNNVSGLKFDWCLFK